MSEGKERGCGLQQAEHHSGPGNCSGLETLLLGW